MIYDYIRVDGIWVIYHNHYSPSERSCLLEFKDNKMSVMTKYKTEIVQPIIQWKPDGSVWNQVTDPQFFSNDINETKQYKHGNYLDRYWSFNMSHLF